METILIQQRSNYFLSDWLASESTMNKMSKRYFDLIIWILGYYKNKSDLMKTIKHDMVKTEYRLINPLVGKSPWPYISLGGHVGDEDGR